MKSRKLINLLFTEGKSIGAFPLKALWALSTEVEEPILAGVTVSSRNFRKAVQRNRVKRVMREAYRLNQQPLKEVLQQSGKHLLLFFIYTGRELPVYEELTKKMQQVIEKLRQEIVPPPNT